MHLTVKGAVIVKRVLSPRWLSSGICAVLVLVLAGCSKGNQSASGTSGQSGTAAAAAPAGESVQVKAGSDPVDLAIQKVGVDPCTLLTKTEVQAALGSVPIPKRKVETLTAPSAACDWETDLSILSMRVAGPGSGATFDKLLDKDRGHAVEGV